MDFRDWFWRRITLLSLQQSNKVQAHYAPSDDDYVRPILMERRYPGLLGAKMYLSENTPKSEAPSTFTAVSTKFVLWIKKVYTLSYTDVTPWSGPVPYPDDFLSQAPAPVMPEDLQGDVKSMLEGFVRRGPYSMYTTPVGDERHFDFRAFESFAPRAPFINAGGLARFKPKGDGTFDMIDVTFAGTTYTPADGQAFEVAAKRIVCAINSYSTFVDHLTHVHLCGANTWSICTHLAFSARHPMRVLLQPFIVETMRVNNDNIDGLIRNERMNVPCYTGYPLATLNAVMKGAFDAFDLRWFDAEMRQKKLKHENGEHFPTTQSAVDVFRLYRKFTKAWCDEHFTEVDAESRIWAKELDARVPNGVKDVLGIKDLDKDLTTDHLAHLAALGMFAASGWHFTVANMLRNYELFPDKVPTAITKEGVPTLGIMREKRNSIAIAGVFRYRLVDDAYMPTKQMKTLWDAFQTDLKAYEAGIDPALKPYSIIPSLVPSSVHA